MKILISRIFYFTKSFLNKTFCNHLELYTSSCPYTEKTYTNCKKCLKRLAVEITK
jgi:hypothetical protein